MTRYFSKRNHFGLQPTSPTYPFIRPQKDTVIDSKNITYYAVWKHLLSICWILIQLFIFKESRYIIKKYKYLKHLPVVIINIEINVTKITFIVPMGSSFYVIGLARNLNKLGTNA